MPDNPKLEVYEPSKVQVNEYDAIVIGTGIGGLSVASLLAQAGKKMLVLEQHSVAGGACHTFKRNGYEFATGIHMLTELSEGSDLRHVLDSLTAIDDQIEWDRMDDTTFETIFLGDPPVEYKFVAGEENFKRVLLERFPDEEMAIEKYLQSAKKAKAAFERAITFKMLPLPLVRLLVWTGLYRLFDRGYHRWVNRSLKDYLATLTKNKDLQAILASDYGSGGVEPSRAPSIFLPLVVLSLLQGVFYPRGGSSIIPKKVIRCITDNNGQVLVSAAVKRILIDEVSGKVKGVEMVDGQKVLSDVVLSDVGFINTARKLLPQGLVNVEFANAGTDDKRLHASKTGMSLFVGLKGDAKSLKLPRSIVRIHASSDLDGTNDKIRSSSLDEILQLDPKAISPIFISCPCTADSTWSERYPDKSIMEINVFAEWSWFEKFQSFDKNTMSHGTEYETVKKRIANKIWERVVQVLEPTGAKLPETLDGVDHYDFATPLTFAHFFKAEQGAFYGLDNDITKFKPETFFLRLRPEIPEVPGLFLTGQDVTTNGFVGATMSGLLCAMKVLGVNDPKKILRRSCEKSKGQKEDEVGEGKVEQPLTE